VGSLTTPVFVNAKQELIFWVIRTIAIISFKNSANEFYCLEREEIKGASIHNFRIRFNVDIIKQRRYCGQYSYFN